MAKLYFRYGTVGSAKTLNLLAVAHNYRQQGKQVQVLKPKLDVRFGEAVVRSRAGLEQTADLLIDDNTLLDLKTFEKISCVLVDEIQFLKSNFINQLRRLATEVNVPVICYGLRTDFRGALFEASKRLFELADSIEEVKTTCSFCNKKATMNLKHLDGRATIAGPSIELGAEEKYLPACYHCYTQELTKAAN